MIVHDILGAQTWKLLPEGGGVRQRQAFHRRAVFCAVHVWIKVYIQL
jgi:hypothetical protein